MKSRNMSGHSLHLMDMNKSWKIVPEESATFPHERCPNGWDGFGSSGGVGWAEMAVRVKDNDPNQAHPEEMGNWSNQIKTSLLLAQTIYKVQLPFLTR